MSLKHTAHGVTEHKIHVHNPKKGTTANRDLAGGHPSKNLRLKMAQIGTVHEKGENKRANCQNRPSLADQRECRLALPFSHNNRRFRRSNLEASLKPNLVPVSAPASALVIVPQPPFHETLDRQFGYLLRQDPFSMHVIEQRSWRCHEGRRVSG